MRALLKASLSRPLFCLALGLSLGIAPLKILAFPSQALLAFLSLSLIVFALLALKAGRDLALALALAALGFCLGLLRSQGLARLLQAAPQPAVAAASLNAVVQEDLGLRKESRRQALLLMAVQVED